MDPYDPQNALSTAIFNLESKPPELHQSFSSIPLALDYSDFEDPNSAPTTTSNNTTQPFSSCSSLSTSSFSCPSLTNLSGYTTASGSRTKLSALTAPALLLDPDHEPLDDTTMVNQTRELSLSNLQQDHDHPAVCSVAASEPCVLDCATCHRPCLAHIEACKAAPKEASPDHPSSQQPPPTTAQRRRHHEADLTPVASDSGFAVTATVAAGAAPHVQPPPPPSYLLSSMSRQNQHSTAHRPSMSLSSAPALEYTTEIPEIFLDPHKVLASIKKGILKPPAPPPPPVPAGERDNKRRKRDGDAAQCLADKTNVSRSATDADAAKPLTNKEERHEPLDKNTEDATASVASTEGTAAEARRPGSIVHTGPPPPPPGLPPHLEAAQFQTGASLPGGAARPRAVSITSPSTPLPLFRSFNSAVSSEASSAVPSRDTSSTAVAGVHADAAAAAAASRTPSVSNITSTIASNSSSSSSSSNSSSSTLLAHTINQLGDSAPPYFSRTNLSDIDDPDTLLTTPNHVTLNHLATSCIKNSILAAACTSRYKSKYITQILYTPM